MSSRSLGRSFARSYSQTSQSLNFCNKLLQFVCCRTRAFGVQSLSRVHSYGFDKWTRFLDQPNARPPRTAVKVERRVKVICRRVRTFTTLVCLETQAMGGGLWAGGERVTGVGQ